MGFDHSAPLTLGGTENDPPCPFCNLGPCIISCHLSWLLLAHPPKVWPLWSKGINCTENFGGFWPTGCVDAPTLSGIQGHQDRHGRCKRGDASLCSAGNTKLLQTLFSFLGCEAKVPPSRGGFVQRFRTANLSSIKFIYIQQKCTH